MLSLILIWVMATVTMITLPPLGGIVLLREARLRPDLKGYMVALSLFLVASILLSSLIVMSMSFLPIIGRVNNSFGTESVAMTIMQILLPLPLVLVSLLLSAGSWQLAARIQSTLLETDSIDYLKLWTKSQTIFVLLGVTVATCIALLAAHSLSLLSGR